MMPLPISHSSPALSSMASSELRQSAAAAPVSPSTTKTWTTALLVLAAAGGIAAGFIPKKEKAWRKAAIGTSVGALAGTALLFTLGN